MKNATAQRAYQKGRKAYCQPQVAVLVFRQEDVQSTHNLDITQQVGQKPQATRHKGHNDGGENPYDQ